jgi:hypothetical protein
MVMIPLVGLPVLALFMAISYYLGRAILRPLVESEVPGAHVQFRITDIYVLIAQFMVFGTIMVGQNVAGDQSEKLLALIPIWAILSWWWWMGVRRLSRAGITDNRRRAVILGLAVPFAFGNYFLLLLLIPLASRMDGSAESNPVFSSLFLALLLLSLYMVFSGCRKMAEWAVASVKDKQP